LHTKLARLLPAVFVARLVTAQASTSLPPDFHDRVTAAIAAATNNRLPPGDTLITWTSAPVLFHTSGARGANRQSGMLRGDGMVGVATVSMASGKVVAFSADWTESGKPTQSLRGTLVGERLELTGSRAAVVSPPLETWAVADYGMEDLMGPVLRALSTETLHRIAVFRPFGFKWDTVAVRSVVRAGLLAVDFDGESWVVFNTAGQLVWRKQRGVAEERRPLEGTARFADYRRARALLPEIK
jgi:hypothetical protein